MANWKITGLVVAVGAAAAAIIFMPHKPVVMPPPPNWAYVVSPPAKPGAPKPAPDPTLMHMPGSNAAFTRAQTGNRFQVADWHPELHPPLPGVVAHGQKPHVAACGLCHLPTGQGRPENAPLAGQPAAYLLQQIEEFRSGRRHSSQPKLGPPKSMLEDAKYVTPQDLKEAVAYFSSLTFRPWIRVVETATVPKTEPDSHSMLMVTKGAGSEPIGQRIIEVAENPDRTELRDTSIGFVAYVPPGSIARGAALVRSGGGAQPCRACHGPALKGMGVVPAIAGRSPSYLTRQLFDIQYGARSGPAVEPMRTEVARMTDANRIDVVAYLASLHP